MRRVHRYGRNNDVTAPHISIRRYASYTFNAGCEYGDNDAGGGYCKSIQKRECYNIEVRRRCCFTCHRLRDHQAQAGCEFGDKASWCSPDTLNRYQCYQLLTVSTCCVTCATYLTGPPGRNTTHDFALKVGIRYQSGRLPTLKLLTPMGSHIPALWTCCEGKCRWAILGH